MITAKSAACIFTGLLALLLLPTRASAQSTISGVVKDSSGAVIANATVEAASDVLIEKVRTAVTNSEGRYAIVDLRPGTYTVTATASGFAAVKQQVEVPANVSVPVDAELRVGSVGETVNVEARPATVDVENVAHPETLTRAEMDTLPTGRYMQSIASYVPGAHLNLPDIGGSQQIEQNYISVHGNGSLSDTYMLDGMAINTNYADGAIQQYVDNAMVAETTEVSSNVTAEVSAGGMLTNLIPREGGNAFHGNIFLGGSDGRWQSDNIDQSLINRAKAANPNNSLTPQVRTDRIEDFNGSIGGPIKKDKLWFLLSGRDQLTFTQAGNSTYPDGRPGIQDGGIYEGSLRLTWQINQKNKFSIFETRNWKYKDHEILDGGQTGIPADPSTASTRRGRWPMYFIAQAKWTGTPTPKLILEAGATISHLDYNDVYQPGIAQTPFTPSWFAMTSDYDISRNARYVAGFANQYYQTNRNLFMGQASYVTGSHQIKVGIQEAFGPFRYSRTMNGDGWQEFLNGAPFAFLAFNTPYHQSMYLKSDLAIYATDTWHLKRLAITAGLRWEYLSAEIKPETAEAGRFVGARTFPNYDCSKIPGMGCWKTWSPRLGLVYDVFANHKTAIKAGFGKYETPQVVGFTNNFNPMVLSTATVAWNGGTTACEPTCFAPGSPTPAGQPIPAGGLGPISPTFGAPTNIPRLNPNWQREFNLQYTAGVQQQLAKGVTLNFNWYRRSDYQQTLLLNYAIPPSAWTRVDAVNPLDGSALPIFNLQPQYKLSSLAPVLYQTNAPRSLVNNVYTGYETSVVARLPRGAFIFAGWTVERSMDRSCAQSPGTASSFGTLGGQPVDDPNYLRFCDMFGDLYQDLGAVPNPPWAHDFKLSASYPVRWGFVVSASFYSNRYGGGFAPPGSPAFTASTVAYDGYLPRTWNITSTTRYPSDCAKCPAATDAAGAGAGLRAFVDPGMTQPSETLQLVAPGQVLTPRLNQLDFGFKRVFRFKDKYTLEPEAQIFNTLNSNAAIAQATAVSTTVAPFLPQSACSSSSGKYCGVGGPATTVTNPRLLRLALLFRF